MPVRRGHVAPHNTFIDTIIRKFDGLNRKFLVANAQIDCYPIIYCNDGFCELVGYSRAELMQRSCMCEFLHGPLTSTQAVGHVRETLAVCLERQLEILYYRKDGSKFLCSQVIAPIRNEEGSICMFIMNFEDVTDAPYRDELPLSALPAPLRKRAKLFKFLLPGTRKTRDSCRDKIQSDGRTIVSPDPEIVAMETIPARIEPTSDAISESQVKAVIGYTDLSTVHPAYNRIGPTSAVSQPDLTVYKSEHQRPRALTIDIGQATSNSLNKSLPVSTSDPDLARFLAYQYRKSPSISNLMSDSTGKYKENNNSSTTSRFLLKDVHSHSKHHVGEKVAQSSCSIVIK